MEVLYLTQTWEVIIIIIIYEDSSKPDFTWYIYNFKWRG